MERSIFISYASADKATADQICAALEQAGYGCWIAPRDIEPGADYPAAILGGLRQARTVVVIVSAAAVASPHVLTEIGHAFSEKKSIIPFRLSAATLPPDFDYFLSMSQWLDAPNGCTPESLGRLKEAVSQTRAAAAPGLPARRVRSRNIVLAAGVLLLAALGGIVIWRRPAAKVQPPAVPPVAGEKTGEKTVEKTGANEVTKNNPSETRPQPWVNPKDDLTYVWIPPGSFTMGCSPGDTECKPDESPAHLVELPAGFWMGQTEVTNAAYRRIVPSATFAAGEAKLPVTNISWREAKTYCAAIGGRLPAEAEWEYAARGGVASAYYGVPSRIAWYAANSGGVRHQVGAKQPNAYGLYDMLGNASEWVLDRYYNKYDIEAPAIGNVDQPLASNASATARGGFWESEAPNIRVSRRAEMEKDEPAPMAGIRCVVDRK